MRIKKGEGKTEYGPGVSVELTSAEVSIAIEAYLVAHGVYVSGPRTVTVNGETCCFGRVYVDPSGYVVSGGFKYLGSSGRGYSE